VYLINILPSAPLKFDIPYTVLFQIDPDYQFLRVFGCSCFPFLRPYYFRKLEFGSSECVLLGYSPSCKGYKCMSSSGHIFMSKDVIFNEHHFPYTKLFSTSSSNYVSIASFFTTLPIIESFSLPPSSLNTSPPQSHSSLPSLEPHSFGIAVSQSSVPASLVQDTTTSIATVNAGTSQSNDHSSSSATDVSTGTS